MHPEHRLAGELLEQPVGEHRLGAADPLFGRLEDEVHAALEIPGPGKVARRPEQHGRVAVVAAGVHHAGRGRPVGEAVRLRDRQGVHVGAQADCPGRVADPQRSHHPGPPDTGGDLEPP